MPSFTASVKTELVRLIPERECCRQAEISALVQAGGRLEVQGGRAVSLYVNCGSSSLARKVLLLLKGLFNLKMEVLPPRRGRGGKGGRIYSVFAPAQEGLAGALSALGLKVLQGGEIRWSSSRQPRHCCARAYLRGAFLAGGAINPPAGDYHLEVVAHNQRQARLLRRLMASFGLRPGLNQRKGQQVVYLKGSEQIADFLKAMGAQAVLFSYENARVVKEVRNGVNRLVNAETANVNKTVEASFRQLENIRYLRDHLGLERLSAPLRQAASLRLEHPDLSLKELGEMLEPRVTKSGVNHRLRRLEEKAEKIRAQRLEGRS